jgi:hypothetical protein
LKKKSVQNALQCHSDNHFIGVAKPLLSSGKQRIWQNLLLQNFRSMPTADTLAEIAEREKAKNETNVKKWILFRVCMENISQPTKFPYDIILQLVL